MRGLTGIRKSRVRPGVKQSRLRGKVPSRATPTGARREVCESSGFHALARRLLPRAVRTSRTRQGVARGVNCLAHEAATVGTQALRAGATGGARRIGVLRWRRAASPDCSSGTAPAALDLAGGGAGFGLLSPVDTPEPPSPLETDPIGDDSATVSPAGAPSPALAGSLTSRGSFGTPSTSAQAEAAKTMANEPRALLTRRNILAPARRYQPASRCVPF
jgi:hypothetical protein